MKTLHAKDLSPIEGGNLKAADEQWLRQLQVHLTMEDHVIRLGEVSEEAEPVVSCGYDGVWRAGRYVGSISLGGRRIEIAPRFRHEVLAGWIAAAFNLIVVPHSSKLADSDAVIPPLLALLWCREFDQAARHGLPFLRVARTHHGLTLRGRLAVAETIGHRRAGRKSVASRRAERTLEHDLARTIVCAQRALSRMLGGDYWMTPRVRELMPHLWAAVGTRPRLPSRVELTRLRYTPIRRPFRPFVERSWRIARQQGFVGAGTSDEAEGVLLDVAELWERFVAHCTRRAFPALEVAHGTSTLTAENSEYLLRSTQTPGRGLGQLKPDVLITDDGLIAAIIDAKYKLLRNRTDAPDGVLREDRYQLAAYLSAMGAGRATTGMLAYPAEADQKTGNPLPIDIPGESTAQSQGPWVTEQESAVFFTRLPVDVEGCTSLLSRLLTESPASPPALPVAA